MREIQQGHNKGISLDWNRYVIFEEDIYLTFWFQIGLAIAGVFDLFREVLPNPGWIATLIDYGPN